MSTAIGILTALCCTSSVAQAATDTVPPTVKSITTPKSPNNRSDVDLMMYTITFSEKVSFSSFDLSSLSNKGTAGTCTYDATNNTGSNAVDSINVFVLGCNGTGHDGTSATSSVILRLAPRSVTDLAGNLGPAKEFIAAPILLDERSPQSTWSSLAGPTNKTSLLYNLSFNENVVGLAASDFANTGTATGCRYAASAASGKTFKVTVTGCSDGTLVVKLVSDAVSDAAGNTSAEKSASSVALDRTIPTATWSTVPASPNNSSILSFALSFSESVTGLTSSDLSNVGTAKGCSFAIGTPTGNVYPVTVSKCSDGTVAPRLAVKAVTDAAANAGPAALLTSSAVTLDRVAPKVKSFFCNPDTQKCTLTFSEPVVEFADGDVSYVGASTNWSLSAWSASSTTVYVADIVSSGEHSPGGMQWRLAAGSVKDQAGNSGPAAAVNSMWSYLLR